MVFQPQARDTYSIAVSRADGSIVGGNVFATRAEAEAFAAPFVAAGRFTVTGTCPSYDRVYLDSISQPTTSTGRPFRQGDPIETDPDRETRTIF